MPEMTTPRYNHTLCGYKHRVYAFGGTNRVYLDSIEYYENDTWTKMQLTLPTPRNYSCILPVKSGLLLVGGINGMSSGFKERHVHHWVADSDTWLLLSDTKVNYALSNAIALRKGVLYVFDHTKTRVIEPLSLLNCK